MPATLVNLPEDHLYALVPPQVANLDVRGLIEAVVGGLQDTVADLRSYINRYPNLVNAAPVPLTNVFATYTGVAGTPVTVTLDADDTTPSDPVDLLAWSAAQLEVDPALMLGAVLGTDALRVIGVDTVQQLAASLGAVLYPGLPTETPDEVAARRAKILPAYFPRLRIKGTAQSFSAFARLAGFDNGTLTPLWSRVSPRVPANVGDPANALDFTAVPDIYPTGQLPDPDCVYAPQALTDGPFYHWNSGTLVTDPRDPAYYPSAVNGFSPFIKLNVGPGATVNHPPPGTYQLVGGAPGRTASVQLSSGTDISNLNAQALTAGAAFNGITICVSGSGTNPRIFDVVAQLSTVKYRSSYYDTGLFRADAGTCAVTVNQDLVNNPALTPDGTAQPPYRPWSGGSAPTPTVSLWPTRSVTTAGTGTKRVQAAGTLVEVDVPALVGDAQRVYELASEVTAATRFPRRSAVGLLMNDVVDYAPYPCVATMLINPGTGAYLGTVAGTSLPGGNYTVAFGIIKNPAPPVVLSAQQVYAGTVNFAGPGISGAYKLVGNTWSANVTAGFTGGTLAALLSSPDQDTLRTEPTYAAKIAGTTCYNSAPEGSLYADHWGLGVYDDVPWMRMLRAGGEQVDTNLFQPFRGDPDAVPQTSLVASVPDAAGVFNQVHVYDLIGVAQPPYLKLRTQEPDAPSTVAMALTGSGTQLYPVIGVSPTTIVGAATWKPGRYDNALLWWPLNEHPAQPRSPVPALGPAPTTATLKPTDRTWDPARGWCLALSDGGTVDAPDLGLPNQYSFALNLAVSGGTNPTAEVNTVAVGAAALQLTPGTVTLVVDNAAGGSNMVSLALPAGTNTLVYASIGTGTSTLGLGTATSWGGTASLVVQPAPGQGARLTGANRAASLHDFMVWGCLKTTADLNVIRAPVFVPSSNPNPTPFVGGLRGDRWALRVLPSAYVIAAGADTAPVNYPVGEVRRYGGDGRYAGNPAYKQVGLGGSQTLPIKLTLGTVGPGVPATGLVVTSGTNGEPGYTTAWTGGSFGTIYGVTPPYGPTGGVTTMTNVSGGTNTSWPTAIPQYNAAVDRVYVRADSGSVFEVSIDDLGQGPVFVTNVPLRPRPPAELPFVAPNLRAGREIVSDFESELITNFSILAITSGGTLYSIPASTFGLLQTEGGDFIVTEGGDNIALEAAFGSSTTPWFIYLNSRVKSWAQNAFTRWVNQNAFGQSIGVAALQTAGSLSFENTEPLPLGNYRLTVKSGNLGTLDDQFAGFNVNAVLTTGVGVPLTFGINLNPTATGTNPVGLTTAEFTLPYNVNGPWRLDLNWTNDRDVPSQGTTRCLAVYAYSLRRIASELHTVTLDPLAITPVDVNAIPPLAAGAYVAAYNSFGTVIALTHEQNIYPVTQGADTFNNPRSPLADTITGSTLQRRDRLDVLVPYIPANPVPPSAPTVGGVIVSPSKAYYNLGDNLTLGLSAVTGSNLRTVWQAFGGTTAQLGSGLAPVTVSRTGTQTIAGIVVDSLGNSASARTQVVVNHPPSIQIAAASLETAAVPFITNLNAVVVDPDGDPVTATWYKVVSPGTLAFIGAGTSVAGYSVNATQTVRVLAYDSRGGTSTADVPLVGTTNAAPVTSIVTIAPSVVKAVAVPQLLQLAAVTRDPENRGVSTRWSFWDGYTASGATRQMLNFGGGTYCTVQHTITNQATVGNRLVTLNVTDVDGNVTETLATLNLVANQNPVITGVTVSDPGVIAGAPIYFTAAAFDPDGDPLNYTWSFPGQNLTLFGPNISVATAGLAGQSVGGILTVDDGFGGVVTAQTPTCSVYPGGLLPLTVSPAGGNTTAGVVVTVTSPDSGVSIYYTLDGSDPTIIAGTLYTGAVTLPYVSGKIIPFSARAFKASLAPSQRTEVTFVFNA